MFLFKLWLIDINYQTILSFVIGVLIGCYLLVLIYAIFLLLSLRNVKYIKVNPTDTLTEAEAKEMIEKAVKDYKDKTKRGKNSKSNHFKVLCYDLVYGIASSFFPKSKYPLAEISLSEGIELLGYVQQRMDEILNKRIFRPFKRLRISSIISISLGTKKVVDKKAFQITKSASKHVSRVTKAISVINPLNLARKIFVSSTLSKVTDRLYVIALTIVGEEAFKIYSKAVLKEEVNIESNVDQLAAELDNEIIEAKKDSDSGLIDKDDEVEIENKKFLSFGIKRNDKKEIKELKYDFNKKFLEFKKVEEISDVQEKEEIN